MTVSALESKIDGASHRVASADKVTADRSTEFADEPANGFVSHISNQVPLLHVKGHNLCSLLSS